MLLKRAPERSHLCVSAYKFSNVCHIVLVYVCNVLVYVGTRAVFVPRGLYLTCRQLVLQLDIELFEPVILTLVGHWRRPSSILQFLA